MITTVYFTRCSTHIDRCVLLWNNSPSHRPEAASRGVGLCKVRWEGRGLLWYAACQASRASDPLSFLRFPKLDVFVTNTSFLHYFAVSDLLQLAVRGIVSPRKKWHGMALRLTSPASLTLCEWPSSAALLGTVTSTTIYLPLLVPCIRALACLPFLKLAPLLNPRISSLSHAHQKRLFRTKTVYI